MNNWAPLAFLVAVPLCSREENGNGNAHGQAADAVGPAPTDFVLYVHQHGDGKKSTGAYEKEEPVEEEGHLCSLLVVLFVELICAEARYTGLEPPCSQSYQIQAEVEHSHLCATCFLTFL